MANAGGMYQAGKRNYYYRVFWVEAENGFTWNAVVTYKNKVKSCPWGTIRCKPETDIEIAARRAAEDSIDQLEMVRGETTGMPLIQLGW